MIFSDAIQLNSGIMPELFKKTPADFVSKVERKTVARSIFF